MLRFLVEKLTFAFLRVCATQQKGTFGGANSRASVAQTRGLSVSLQTCAKTRRANLNSLSGNQRAQGLANQKSTLGADGSLI